MLVLEQDPPRRGIDVIELPRANRPGKGRDRGGCKHQREWKHEVQDRHDRNAFDRRELASTVSELSGMAAAAISGWIMPLTASAPAIRL